MDFGGHWHGFVGIDVGGTNMVEENNKCWGEMTCLWQVMNVGGK